MKFLTFQSCLIIFTLQTLCFASLNSSRTFFASSSSSSDGTIPILRDSNGFYVNANLAPPHSFEVPGDDTVKMMLSLMSGETLLAFNCWNFSVYDCKRYNCQYSTNGTCSFPWFLTQENILAKAFVSLDSSYWKLNTEAEIATKCEGNIQEIGLGRYGIIGLKIWDLNEANFVNDKIFSIWIHKDLQNGVLLFGSDPKKYASSSLISTFTSEKDWIVQSQNTTIELGSSYLKTEVRFGFDIHADTTGFQLDLFGFIKSLLRSSTPNAHITCDSSYYKPTCNYTGPFDFPDLKIGVENQGIISIPTEILYINKTNSSFVLNIKAIDPSLSGPNYVTQFFDLSIIFDAKVMSLFYFVFDGTGTDSKIHLYKANPEPKPQSKWPEFFLYYGIILVIAIVVVFFVRKFLRKSADKNQGDDRNHIQGPLLNAENSINNTNNQVSFNYPTKNNYQ